MPRILVDRRFRAAMGCRQTSGRYSWRPPQLFGRCRSRSGPKIVRSPKNAIAEKCRGRGPRTGPSVQCPLGRRRCNRPKRRSRAECPGIDGSGPAPRVFSRGSAETGQDPDRAQSGSGKAVNRLTQTQYALMSYASGSDSVAAAWLRRLSVSSSESTLGSVQQESCPGDPAAKASDLVRSL